MTVSHRPTVAPLAAWAVAMLAVAGVCSLLSCAPPAKPAAAAGGRPHVKITSTESFDAGKIPAYTGTHDAIYAYIDAHQKEHVAELQRWLRQPSISAQNNGITDMANLLRTDLLHLGFKEAELVPTSGHPGVWGYYDAGAPKTLLVYLMYDVQPVEASEWKVPPFQGAIVDHELGKVIMARGATNQKGPERAFFNAVASILAVEKKLPVNLMVAAEGEEELGSPHYPQVVDKYEARMKQASGVFFPFNSQSPDGSVGVSLGVKGILYFEMEAKGGGAHGGPGRAEIHGSYKAITDAPAWRLAQALATLTSPDGNTITVPHYYDAIRPPNAEEQRLVNGMMSTWASQEQLVAKSLDVPRWQDSLTGKDLLAQLLFTTTLNIDGLVSGYTGEGTKTILPNRALAKVDSRLVPNQTPDEALRLIRAHLDAKGFSDIEIHQLSGYPPAQTSVETPLVKAAIGVYNKYGFVPTVAPRLAGSAPYYQFTDRLKLPMIAGGLGHGSGAHGPNEYMVIEPKSGSKIAGLAQVEKSYVDLLYALAGAE